MYQQDLLTLDFLGKCTFAPKLAPYYFNRNFYEKNILNSPELAKFKEVSSRKNAELLSLKIFDLVHDSMAPNGNILLNSSTGKDSTLMVALYCKNALERIQGGRRVHPATVAIADTGTEFPEFTERIRNETHRIRRYAQENKIPLEVEVTKPKATSRLLVELIGKGTALPKKNRNARSMAYSSASWCMDRVKATPLKEIIKNAQSNFCYFIQCIGVRSSESQTRKQTISKYAQNFPFGLTQVGNAKDGKQSHLGCTPIVHWTGEMLNDYLRKKVVPWNVLSMEELANIYHKGSDTSNEASECSISLTKDNGITNVCTDLSGTRFGCWMCMLSKNRSLINTAKTDKRYRWLRGFHKYLYAHHEKNSLRALDRDYSNYNQNTLFPRSFLFEERAWMLLLLFRAEMESGFALIDKEELEAIRMLWRRHGVFTVTPEDIRRDALQWKKTGKPALTYQQFQNLMEHTTVGESIPSGAFFTLTTKQKFNPLNLSNMLGMAGHGTPFFPKLLTYVFKNTLDPQKYYLMVTDTPSIIGTKFKTPLLDDTNIFTWEFIGSREPTSWEKRMCRGRSIFYLYHNPRPDNASLGNQYGQKLIHCHRTSIAPYRNFPKKGSEARHFELAITRNATGNMLYAGCEDEDSLSHEWRFQEEIANLSGKLSVHEFKTISGIVQELVIITEHLEYIVEELRSKFFKTFKASLQNVLKVLVSRSRY